jgi:glutamate-1-semialdehyde 2,1-aminomutase
MLLSKKVSRYLPGSWPATYKKAKKCFIWAARKKFIDFSLMGIGTNILGYANNEINQELVKVIKNSNMSTINSDLHLKLSRILLKLHPWAYKCFYARSGAEANAIALRIARSYTKKNEVVVCGYHGWQDWYLSANINNPSNFGKMLLPGLSATGIPIEIGNLIHTFKYNDLDSLKKIIKKNKNIGTIFMEVERNQKPISNFLKKIRKIATENNIVLIFDECTSGFRETFGGLHLKYNVSPDIAVFGKALGNGIPINSIIGKKNIMDAGKESFISSTFWSDSLGPAAALATLKVMNKNKSWKKISNLGKKIKKKWRTLSLKHGIKIKISGLNSMPMFVFESLKNDYYINFITQEMIKKNYLATNAIYCCTEHDQYIEKYFQELDKIFKKIKDFESGESISLYLKNPLSEKNFSRLN